MKILFVCYAFYPSMGGIESTAEHLLKEWIGDGHDVVVLTQIPIGDQPERQDVIVKRQPGILEQAKLARWADVVYHHNPALSFWPTLVIGKPVVYSLHTWIARQDGSISKVDRIKRWWISRSPWIANSRAMTSGISGTGVVIHNGYDDSIFKLERDWESRQGIAFVGRLVSDKGVPVLLKAARRLVDLGFPMPISIVGSGDELDTLKGLANELGIQQLVTFHGRLEPTRIAELLNQSRYIAIPSEWEEPFGIVALEGMACGAIPIATRSGGLAEAIGEGGLLFDRGDFEGLAELVVRLENNAEEAHSIHEKQTAHLETHRPKAVAREYMGVLQAAAG
ncbi:glycosyltransferase family 4 protein [Rhodopirellula sp. MGV]|uniref:glycosyltransferase family 4 protein n=1 Tax=Rhodopirellula sp. MGV TaxID=2023130 RepID=UPI000B9605B2|nr:glycosyltransferase family 4 protein [Rhodopirellula sp. MGV]OYP34101.1 hypothetical protein CGZ80_16380 [Rhodopirellula sp. MGV]PNY35614.1 glycosyltransferase family 1 protein [Rhodopirellula baltica]